MALRLKSRRTCVAACAHTTQGMYLRLMPAFSHTCPVSKPSRKAAAAAYLGRLGGQRRAKRLSATERADSARQAALARWAKLTTPEQRRRATKKANVARWAKHTKRKKV